MIGAISLHCSCVSGPEIVKKCNEIAAFIVVCYLKVENVPKLYVTKYNDWCNFVAFLCVLCPETHQKCNEIAKFIVLFHADWYPCTLLHMDWERSQTICNKVQ